jgi:replicative DNA helicase
VKAAQLAETATLGSLLIDPSALRQVTTWLRTGDFADPWHGQLYTVMRERLVAGEAVDAENVGLQLLERFGPHRADLPRVVGLLRTVPVRPQSQRYAAMVLDSSLRREVAGQGVVLRASALSAALCQERRPVVAGTALVEDALTAGEGRWQLASGEAPSGAAPHPELAPALRNLDTALSADRLLAAHPDLDLQQAREHERRLVAALVCHPREASGIGRWLSPDSFVDRPSRAVYAALLDLVERGQPIDVVTVAWQMQQASRQSGPGPDLVTFVRDVDAATVDDPRFYSRPVAADLVRRTADSAARALTAAAANPGIDVPDLFETARLLTATVRSAASGLPDRSTEAAPARHLAAVRAEPTPVRSAALSGPVAG